MEKRRTRGKIASLIAAVLLVALMAVPVSAATTYAPIAGTTTNFIKYLIVDSDANIPEAEFSFTVSAGAPATPAAGEIEVYAGPNPEKVVVGTAGKTAFTAGQSTTPGADTDNITNSTAKKYAHNKVAVDFTQVSFSNPGIYRYLITETAQAAGSAYTNDSEAVRTIDVYVQDNNGALEVQGYVMYKGNVTYAPKMNATLPTGIEKSNNYINEYTTYDLTVGKEVKGNQGSKDKYFEFTVTLAGAEIKDDNLYTIETANFDTNPVKTDSTKYTTMTQPADENSSSADGVQVKGSTLKTGMKVYLKHDQYIIIDGIPKGTTYTVTEEAEDYTSTGSSTTKTVTYSTISATDSTNGTIDADKVTGFENEKGGVIPTGILLSATPWIIVGLVVVAGIVFFAIRSKKKYDEE